MGVEGAAGGGWWWVRLTLEMVRHGFSLVDKARETDSPPCTLTQFCPQQASSAVCGTTGPISVSGMLALRGAACGLEARHWFWVGRPPSAGRRAGLVAPCSQTRPTLHSASPAHLASASTLPPHQAVFCSQPFCQIPFSVDNRQPSFAAKSFLALPRPTPGMPSFLVFEGSGGQKAGGTLTRVSQ